MLTYPRFRMNGLPTVAARYGIHKRPNGIVNFLNAAYSDTKNVTSVILA